MPDKGLSWGDFQKEKLYKGGYKRLRNWKDDGFIEVWIHTASAFFKRIFIMIPYIAEEKNEKTGRMQSVIKYFPYVSHEEIDDFVNRRKNREYYRCPLLRFIDWLTNNGYVDDDQTVFEVSIKDKKRDRICTKADFIGDVNAGGDWQLSMKPTLQYVMAVIDNSKPKDGIVVTAEKFSLGEAIKRAVRKEIDRKGPEIGDPHNNPYCFKWVFDPRSNSPANYYDAYPMERNELTDEIAELLNEPAQDMDDWIMPGDVDFLRKIFENHITIDDVPWDDLFDNTQEDYSTFGGTDIDNNEDESEPKKQTKRTRASSKPKPEPEPEEDNSIVCPTCKGKGKRRGKKCKVCDGTGEIEVNEDDNGSDEEDTGESSEPEPPPKKDNTRKRGRRARKPAPPPEPEEDEGEMDQCDNCKSLIPQDVDSCPHCGVSFE